jgi:hypothetical protein
MPKLAHEKVKNSKTTRGGERRWGRSGTVLQPDPPPSGTFLTLQCLDPGAHGKVSIEIQQVDAGYNKQ